MDVKIHLTSTCAAPPNVRLVNPHNHSFKLYTDIGFFSFSVIEKYNKIHSLSFLF
jgi:hypothetical protein